MPVVALLLFIATVAPAPAQQAPSDDEARVRQVMASFLTAFNNLDWPAFRALWTDRPVIFLPFTDSDYAGERIDDPARFDAVWQRLFQGIKENAIKRGASAPPYQNIHPRDLRVDFPHRDVAVVTFHLGSAGAPNIGRRLFVLARGENGWKITHLHASNMTVKPAGP